MNRTVYALLTVAVLSSVLNVAQAETMAETMAERKQRIMRKYMRERQDIVQGDFGLPEAVQEDALVVESQQFKELGQEFARQKNVTMPRMVQPYQRVPLESERSWWMEAAEGEEDSFANPFSSKANTDEESSEAWSPWGLREDSSVYGRRDGQDNTYSGRREDSSTYGGAARRQWGGRDATYPGSPSEYDNRSQSGNRSSVSGMTYDGYTTRRAPASRESERVPGYYGRQQVDTRGTGFGWELDSAGRYNSSPSMGLPQSSLPSPSDTLDWSSQSQTPGYTPYKSPYQAQGDEQRRYGDNLQPQPSQYMRPNNYQKWKDSNKALDPTAGNPYLDELMRNERR